MPLSKARSPKDRRRLQPAVQWKPQLVVWTPIEPFEAGVLPVDTDGSIITGVPDPAGWNLYDQAGGAVKHPTTVVIEPGGLSLTLTFAVGYGGITIGHNYFLTRDSWREDLRTEPGGYLAPGRSFAFEAIS